MVAVSNDLDDTSHDLAGVKQNLEAEKHDLVDQKMT